MENNMGEVFIKVLMELKGRVNGRMGKKLNG
jgi:hypothetical protein